MHHGRRVRLDPRSEGERIVYRLDVRKHGVEDAVLGSRRIGCVGRLVTLATAEKQER
jgi:hypothetical protein